jgi:hypothetical protein
MSNHEYQPGDNNGDTQAQQAHSGVQGFEQPVYIYDKTPLSDAPLDYDPRHEDELTTAHLPSDLQAKPEAPRRSNKNRLIAAGTTTAIGLAGVGLWASGLFGGDKDSDVTPVRPETSSSATTNPGENTPEASNTETPEQSTESAETELNLSDLSPTQFSVEKYQDGDALIRATSAEFNKWAMSGVDISDTVDWGDHEASIASIAQDYDQKYIDAHFVSDWQDRPQLVEAIKGYTERHRIVLYASIMTDSNEIEDEEPYQQSERVTMSRVDEQTADKIVASYQYELSSNADKNRADEQFIELVDGRGGGGTITYVNEGGVWKISDIVYFGG